jgi:hypothetical protein
VWDSFYPVKVTNKVSTENKNVSCHNIYLNFVGSDRTGTMVESAYEQHCDRSPERMMFRRRHWLKPECKNGIRNRGLRQQLQRKRQFTKIYRKSIELEIAR